MYVCVQVCLMCCGHADCTLVNDAGSFFWCEVVFSYSQVGLFTLKADGRLDPINIIISIDSLNHV